MTIIQITWHLSGEWVLNGPSPLSEALHDPERPSLRSGRSASCRASDNGVGPLKTLIALQSHVIVLLIIWATWLWFGSGVITGLYFPTQYWPGIRVGSFPPKSKHLAKHFFHIHRSQTMIMTKHLDPADLWTFLSLEQIKWRTRVNFSRPSTAGSRYYILHLQWQPANGGHSRSSDI